MRNSLYVGFEKKKTQNKTTKKKHQTNKLGLELKWGQHQDKVKEKKMHIKQF